MRVYLNLPKANVDRPTSHQFSGCKRSFITKTGCGVHMRRAHSDWADEVNRTETVKARWTQEEISLLARREAELSLRGVRFINQKLLGFLPDRTLESIKSMRKRADYRALVQEYIARINREAEARRL